METNEFVFKRKRRRLCVHHEDTQTEMLPDIPLDQSTSSDPPDPGPDLIPEVAVLSEPPSSSPTGTPPTSINRSSQPQATGSTPNVLTVESFLRRSVQTFVQTARIVLRPDNFAPPTRSRAYMREGASQRRMIKKPKRAKKPKKPSRIAQTLYRAAVLTDADPLDTLMESSGVSPTRKPLNFVTFNKFSDFVPTMRLSKNVKLQCCLPSALVTLQTPKSLTFPLLTLGMPWSLFHFKKPKLHTQSCFLPEIQCWDDSCSDPGWYAN